MGGYFSNATASSTSSADLITLPDVTALRADIGSPGFAVALRGYSTIADGGEGIFLWDPGSVTDDGGIAFNSTGLGTTKLGGWRRSYNGPLFPDWYGAKGDGVTDDTSAIKLMFATLQSMGEGAAKFSPGKTYLILQGSLASQSPLGNFSNLNNIQIIGNGAQLTLGTRDFTALGFHFCFAFDNCKNITVDGFDCIGGIVTLATGVAHGIAFIGLHNGCVGFNLPYAKLNGAWTGISSTDNDPPVAGQECRGIDIGYLEVSGGFYGVNGRFSLNDMNIGYLKCGPIYRSLFMGGCDNINALVDSADVAGSRDVIFFAGQNHDVKNCHVRYIHNRDTGSGITDGNVGVTWEFVKPAGVPGDNAPTKLINCSTKLTVKLQTAKTLGVGCEVQKITGAGAQDTTIEGYTIDGLSISGVVDMNSLGQQGLILSPIDDWAAGEFALNINLSNLTVINSAGTNRAIWFNIARALIGTMKVHNTTADSDNVIELFGRNGAGRYDPPDNAVCSIRAVQCQNRFSQGAGNAKTLQQGAAIERSGGWTGADIFVDETQVANFRHTTGDWIGLGPFLASAGYIRFDRDGSLYALNTARNANRRMVEYDGGEQLLIGDSSNLGPTTIIGGAAAYAALTYAGSMRFKASSNGSEIFVSTDRLALFSESNNDYIKLGGTTPPNGPGVYGAAYILMDRDGGINCWNSARNTPVNLIGLDGGDQGFVGDNPLNMVLKGTTVNVNYQTVSRIRVNSTGIGFFNTAGAAQQNITGALSLVVDVNAKAVLTSLKNALVNLGLATDGTT